MFYLLGFDPIKLSGISPEFRYATYQCFSKYIPYPLGDLHNFEHEESLEAITGVACMAERREKLHGGTVYIGWSRNLLINREMQTLQQSSDIRIEHSRERLVCPNKPRMDTNPGPNHCVLLLS
jgi:hypothetical protein